MKYLEKEFTDVQEMDLFIKNYMHEYHPAGYCTSLTIEFVQSYDDVIAEKGVYKIKFTRLDSCD